MYSMILSNLWFYRGAPEHAVIGNMLPDFEIAPESRPLYFYVGIPITVVTVLPRLRVLSKKTPRFFRRQLSTGGVGCVQAQRWRGGMTTWTKTWTKTAPKLTRLSVSSRSLLHEFKGDMFEKQNRGDISVEKLPHGLLTQLLLNDTQSAHAHYTEVLFISLR